MFRQSKFTHHGQEGTLALISIHALTMLYQLQGLCVKTGGMEGWKRVQSWHVPGISK